MKKNIAYIGFIGLILLVPSFVLADHGGLVPCHGIDCSLCSFFELFVRIFNYVALMVPVLATGLAAWGGFLYITSGGSSGQVEKARGILLNTVIGVAIFYASYVLASTVVTMVAVRGGAQSLGFDKIVKGEFAFACNTGGIENTMDAVLKNGITLDLAQGTVVRDEKGNIKIGDEGGIVNSTILPEGNYTRSEGVNTGSLTSDVKDGLNKASSQLRTEGVILHVTSGYRSLDKQKALVAQNCLVDADGSAQCSPPTCVPGNSASNCPHLTGQAVDVSGINSSNVGCVQGTRVVYQPCQDKVIQAMK